MLSICLSNLPHTHNSNYFVFAGSNTLGIISIEIYRREHSPSFLPHSRCSKTSNWLSSSFFYLPHFVQRIATATTRGSFLLKTKPSNTICGYVPKRRRLFACSCMSVVPLLCCCFWYFGALYAFMYLLLLLLRCHLLLL